MKAFEHPPRTTTLSKKQMAAMLWLLYLNGPVDDPTGGAARKLLARLRTAGYPMSINTLNRLVNSMCETRRESKTSDYPYTYVERIMNGKRSTRIALIVDPREVPFPDNPFKDNPRFKSAAGDERPTEKATPPVPVPAEPPETYARQAVFEQFTAPPPPPVQPGAEVEPEVETEPEPARELVPSTGTLERYELPTEVRVNGDEDLFELPNDLLQDLDDIGGRRSTDLVTQAISLLGEALGAIGTEQLDLVTLGIGQQIDERLSEYRLVQDRADRAEGQLRHVLGQYEKVVDMARGLRKENALLKRRLASTTGVSH